MYKPYVSTAEYYDSGGNIPADEIHNYLIKASRHIDALTFNRIQTNKLTEFQSDIIKEAVIDQSNFLYDNREMIDSVIQSYSINGVSVNCGAGFNVVIEGGLPIKSTTYNLLKQTGLCWRGAI
jgi:membrane-associated HD superfamily phosphohydrolase